MVVVVLNRINEPAFVAALVSRMTRIGYFENLKRRDQDTNPSLCFFQATLTLQPPPNMHESVEGYRSFFHGIVGFFVCEDHVLNTGNGLVSRGHLDEVWAMASSRILSTLQVSSCLQMTQFHSAFYLLNIEPSEIVTFTHVSFKRRRFASFFSSRAKRIKTTREVAVLLTYSIDQATFASPYKPS